MRTFVALGFCLCFSFLICPGKGVASDLIYHLQPDKTYDPQNQYFLDLLSLALDSSSDKYGQYKLIPIKLSMYQERQLKSLNDGIIDILWTATTPRREKQALAVKFPLLEGMLGKRVFVILRKNQIRFSQINTLADLKELTALQGHDWPDAKILSHNGLTVKTTHWYNRMYSLLSEGFVDYFPRGILEASQELRQQNNDDLVIESKHLLSYPLYMYYFVSKKKPRLADRLLYGLNQARDKGTFQHLLYNSPAHAPALEAVNMEGRTVHSLDLPEAYK